MLRFARLWCLTLAACGAFPGLGATFSFCSDFREDGSPQLTRNAVSGLGSCPSNPNTFTAINSVGLFNDLIAVASARSDGGRGTPGMCPWEPADCGPIHYQFANAQLEVYGYLLVEGLGSALLDISYSGTGDVGSANCREETEPELMCFSGSAEARVGSSRFAGGNSSSVTMSIVRGTRIPIYALLVAKAGSSYHEFGDVTSLSQVQLTLEPYLPNRQDGELLPFEVVLQPVPEPGTWAVVAGGLFALALRRQARIL